jgi:hypothetical protein
MRSCSWWVHVVTGVAVAVIAVSTIALAVRQRSWDPVISTAWLPAVVVAVWPGTSRPALSRRRDPAR